MILRGIQNLGRAVAAVIISPSIGSACSVCFGDKESNLTQATFMGIWVMLAVLAGVLGLVVKYIIAFTHRAKLLNHQ